MERIESWKPKLCIEANLLLKLYGGQKHARTFWQILFVGDGAIKSSSSPKLTFQTISWLSPTNSPISMYFESKGVPMELHRTSTYCNTGMHGHFSPIHTAGEHSWMLAVLGYV